MKKKESQKEEFERVIKSLKRPMFKREFFNFDTKMMLCWIFQPMNVALIIFGIVMVIFLLKITI